MSPEIALSGRYVAVPVGALALVLGRYCRSDMRVDDASDLAVQALSDALDRWYDTDGGRWPGVEPPTADASAGRFADPHEGHDVGWRHVPADTSPVADDVTVCRCGMVLPGRAAGEHTACISGDAS